ncbi:MAG: heme exporter protein CcmB [Bacteroidetes bacterium]|nr:heme exporter protein CcmB [Bacteroidota bacterium]
MLRAALAVFRKDLRQELRRRVAVNTLVVFALATVLVVYFATVRAPLDGRAHAALLWVIVVFAASVGLGRAFTQEVEQGTDLLLRQHVPPGAVYAGKLLFTLLLTGVLGGVAAGVYVLVVGVGVPEPLLLVATLALGGAGLAAATTLLSALIARAQGGAALLPVLLFPVLVPLLLAAVRLTRAALDGGFGWTGTQDGFVTLGAFLGLVVLGAILLFEYVWDE